MNKELIVNSYFILVLSLLLMVSGCSQKSEKESDVSAGLNGGFEISKNGLPVNWLIYSPKTVSDGDFDVELDQVVFKEGKQSLKFEVRNCSSEGAWKSPGLTNEFSEVGKYEGEGRYRLSLWIKNSGAKFRLSAGGVSEKEGEMRTLIEESDQMDEWKLLEYEVSVPSGHWVRVELNILESGTIWIDDVKVVKI